MSQYIVMPYRFEASDRNYTTHSFIDLDSGDTVTLEVDIVGSKLMHGDVITVDGGVVRKSSPARDMERIYGILILYRNKTYGKEGGVSLYRCIPDDKRLPCFLVPYRQKANDFSKLTVDKYAAFAYNHWSGKHPVGKMVESLGNVTEICNTVEYLLRKSRVKHSVRPFAQYLHPLLHGTPEKELVHDIVAAHGIADRTMESVFTIDPAGCKDFDDAVGIRRYDEGVVLSVYIANVSVWMDRLSAWTHLSDQVSSVYLPDVVHPMLPNVLSNQLCSLKSGADRLSLAMDIVIQDNHVDRIVFTNTLVNVHTNYVYDDPRLLCSTEYLDVLGRVQSLNWERPFLSGGVDNSHDLVAYLMLLYNREGASVLAASHVGIYRTLCLEQPVLALGAEEADGSSIAMPPGVSTFFDTWNKGRGEYAPFRDDLRHDILGVDAYAHLSSPIRRVVDLVNQAHLQSVLGLVPMTPAASEFVDARMSALSDINEDFVAVRRLQNTCEWLYAVHQDEAILESQHDAYVFGMVCKNEYVHEYSVYIPVLKLVSKISTTELYRERQAVKVQIYLFKDEYSTMQKIRVEVVER